MSSPLNSMVHEYLQLHGFSKTASVFEEELKNEVGLQDSSQVKVASDVETAVYKLYVVNCIKNGRQDKAHEFFSKISDFARSNPEWTDWFCLPYVKNPSKEKTFEKYFLPHWQACLIVWLYNFLSIAVQQMDKPKLVLCVEKALKRGDLPTDGSGTQAPTPGSGLEGGLTDDFAVIAQYV
ncbi:hypothetical protein FO519_002551 [Halicephalobus sp. NKZ332]|nr:hypothetical protein FO519_002551 [Halicephalobus sp. NKZ332]